MRKTNKIIIAALLIAILFLGVGYSAIQNVTLNITGTATAYKPVTSLESVTNDNIGDYIDLGNNIVGTESTTDDWRILYVENDIVYAILADYLPNSTGYAEAAGLDITNTETGEDYVYNVYSNTDRDTLLNGLTNTTAWSGLANGISGATATGAPTAELLMNSYNTKNGTSLIYTDKPRLDSSTADYDLYVPHTEVVEGCSRYWLASIYENTSYDLWGMDREGDLGVMGYISGEGNTGLRPIIALPSSTKATKEGDIWKVAENEETNTELDLGLVTNANIGEYIDLGNNIVGTEETTDDWRILYVVEDGVYAILSDYLPNSTGYAANAGLDTMGTYGVYSNTNRDTLISGLTTSSNWNGLANEISGATVTGSPTLDLLMNSYAAETGAALEGNTLDSSMENYNLYIPRTSEIDNCNAYWIATPYESDSGNVYLLNCDGTAWTRGHDYPYAGIRPIVFLPLSTGVTKNENIWIITQTGTGNVGVEVPATETIETTLASASNDNIGEYVDLGNNVVGGESTSDDWRILYVEGDTIYAILADYLPNSTGYAANAGLSTSGTYSVYSETDRDTLLTGLTTESNWNGLANGISGASVTGSPTAELLMNSYNTKNGTTLDYTSKPRLDFRSHLYVPHTDAIDNCEVYWLSTIVENETSSMWYVGYSGYLNKGGLDLLTRGIRPVIALPASTSVSVTNGTWTISK